MDGITLTAIFKDAKSTADGGWRLTFDISDDEAAKVVQVSQLKDTLLQLAVVPVGVGNAG